MVKRVYKKTIKLGDIMNTENCSAEEIRYLRETVRMLETRKNQMIFLCAAGFAAVIGLSDKIPTISIPFILFIVMFVTENLHYNTMLNIYFLNEYLINYSEKFNKYPVFENAYKNYLIFKNDKEEENFFVKRIRKIYKWIFYPFLVFPLAYIFFSFYFIYMNIYEIFKLKLIIFVLLLAFLVFIFFGYLYVLIRNYKLRKMTIDRSIFHEYDEKINRFFSSNQ